VETPFNSLVRKFAPFMILSLGFFSYFLNYKNPPNLFWDENYYVTAVEKYKKNIFFEESHPPWGKLVMYAGERIADPNSNLTVDFEKTDFAREIPPNFSFLGVRLMPAFFGWMNCLLFYFLLLSIIGSPAWAFSLSLLYTLDNALIVHSRGAMLDSIQLFGIMLTLLAYFKAWDGKKFSKFWVGIMGLGVGWAAWTKLNGLIVVLLLPMLLFYLKGIPFKEKLKKVCPAWLVAGAVFSVFTIFVWQTHFSIGKKIEPALNNSGWYSASDETKDIINNPSSHPNVVANFFIQLRDYMIYMNHYSDGVPRLNLCKIGENGSPFYWWPFGARTINYRWETPNQGYSTNYLYLVPNPVVWGVALLAVILTLAYFLMTAIFGSTLISSRQRQSLVVVSILYVFYIFIISRIERVMYTYHYFIPLIFSFIMVAIWLPIIVEQVIPKKFTFREAASQGIFMLAIALAWVYYSPFTYYMPLTCKAFEQRNMFSVWQMFPIQCNVKNTSIYQPAIPPAPPPPRAYSAPSSVLSISSEISLPKYKPRKK
jgi:dolichyl-phosphate-mannose-protein mannosyltransferase